MPDPYEIATWRFEQISPLIDPSLDDAARRAALRQRTAKPVPRPWESTKKRSKKRGRRSTSARPIPKSTLYRWLAAYRKDGLLGLLPKTREDRGRARHPGTATWISYAIALLYEQPDRSLLQLEVYLRAEFPDYALSRTVLRCHLRAHPAYPGVDRLRSGKKRKLRDLYEADHPHEGWQLDGKGPFTVRFVGGTTARVHVLTILDDHSRAALAGLVAKHEDAAAAITVLERAVAKWGLADRFQFDRGSAFDSHVFRKGSRRSASIATSSGPGALNGTARSRPTTAASTGGSSRSCEPRRSSTSSICSSCSRRCWRSYTTAIVIV